MEQDETNIEEIKRVYAASLVPGWHVVRAFESSTDAMEYAKLIVALADEKDALARLELIQKIGEVPYGIPEEAEVEEFLGVWFVVAPYLSEEIEQIL